VGLTIVDADGGHQRTISRECSSGGRTAWSPDSKFVYCVNTTTSRFAVADAEGRWIIPLNLPPTVRSVDQR
jgi:hypothetical protein